MVHRCCIPSCGMNVRVAEAKGLSYHCFPTKEPHRDKWIQAIRPHLDKPESFKLVQGYTRICSRHFRTKDYSIDSKKRARLSSTAIPTVFPRKNAPLCVQATSGGLKTKSNKLRSQHPSLTSAINLTLSNSLGENGEILSGSLLIESATISDDQLILTIREDELGQELSREESLHNLTLSSQESLQNLSLSQDESIVPKKRLRRKWNRTAFARTSKGKKKSEDSASIEFVGNSFAEISLSSLLAMTPDLQQKLEGREMKFEKEILLSDEEEEEGHINQVEQELLQSIQAVTIHCDNESGGELEQILLPPTDHESLEILSDQFNHLIVPNDDVGGNFLKGPCDLTSEIERLASDFNTSLLTNSTLPITMEIDELAMAQNQDSSTFNMYPTIDIDFQNVVIISPPQGHTESCELEEPQAKNRVGKKEGKKKLVGIAKNRKKEKHIGKFTVDRFTSCDKDIVYYTGFSSYGNFESFFRSLESRIEKLKITDMMHGVSDLIHQEKPDLDLGEEGGKDEQKKRPNQGRSLSRIDELFMTIIRLKRRLPEKVLGHMFCISQPTVSRIIRAWTMLLSKVVENLPSSHLEKGLQIPSSFRLLFQTDIAKCILGGGSRKSSVSSNPSNSNSPKKCKKTKGDEGLEDSGKFSSSKIDLTDSLVSSLTDPTPEVLHPQLLSIQDFLI